MQKTLTLTLLFILLSAGLARADATIGSAVTFACGDSEASLISRGVVRVSAGAAAIYLGYRQLGSNKDPIAARFDGGSQSWCRTDYEVTGDDNTGYGLLWDGSAEGLYAVFSATGTQGVAGEDFRRFATGGWLSSYTDGSPGGGGGPQVAIIARLDPASGAVSQATFLTARLPSSGKTNSLVVTGLAVEGDSLRVEADSYYSPRNPDKSAMTCSGASPFAATFRLSRELSTALTASAANCTGNSAQPPEQVTLSPPFGLVGLNTFVATVEPLTVALPLTFVWRLNGSAVQTRTLTSRSDSFSHTWPAPVAGQSLQVTVANSQTTALSLPPLDSPLYSFAVVEGRRLYLPLLLK